MVVAGCFEGFHMPDLVVRNLEAEVAQRLEQQARFHGVSQEEELHRILRVALLLPEKRISLDDFKEHLRNMPNVGDDNDFERVAGTMREIDFLE